MDRELRSLRIRLAVAGFVAAYGLVLILLAVVLTSDEQVDVLAPDGSPEAAEEEPQEGDSGDPATLVTALLLAPVAGALSWLWSGRAVRPVARAMALQRHLIEETSHELRTPLSILTTNAEVLLADPEPTIGHYRRGLERSAEVAERMSRVLESLLVDARGRARVLDSRPTDLVRLVRGAVDSLRPLANDQAMTIEVEADGAVRARVDPASVERAVTNLVANGLRHGPADSPLVVTVAAIDEDRAEITVTDRGPGIDPANQAEIFERYWRAGEPDDQEQGSRAGLGLAIVRQVAVAHGGAVEVVSPVADDRGTLLRLIVPT